MVSDRDDIMVTLAKIRECGLLLTLANAYLCEPPFLKRMGRELGLRVGGMGAQIEQYKRQFPGKFAKEVDTEGLLEALRRKAQRMQNPDKELMESCTVGRFGQEMDADIGALSSAVHDIRAQVEGKPRPYTRKDAVSAMLDRGGPAVSGLTLRLIQVFLILMVCGGVVFAYLFFTMEREGDLEGEILAIEAKIQSNRMILSEIEKQKSQVYQKMDSMRGKELDRGEKIKYLELGEELTKLDEKQREVEGRVILREEEIQKRRARIDEMRNKPFIARLLRL